MLAISWPIPTKNSHSDRALARVTAQRVRNAQRGDETREPEINHVPDAAMQQGVQLSDRCELRLDRPVKLDKRLDPDPLAVQQVGRATKLKGARYVQQDMAAIHVAPVPM